MDVLLASSPNHIHDGVSSIPSLSWPFIPLRKKHHVLVHSEILLDPFGDSLSALAFHGMIISRLLEKQYYERIFRAILWLLPGEKSNCEIVQNC